MKLFLTIREGNLVAYDRNLVDTFWVFSLDQAGAADFVKLLRAKKYRPEEGMLCSSSIDFPEDDGGPRDWVLQDWIESGGSLGKPKRPKATPVPTVDHVVLGRLKKTVERIHRIALAEDGTICSCRTCVQCLARASLEFVQRRAK